MRRLILGTAGHIDHGKTALVRALTGTDTDRLPEEKRRGITIDLGFASLELPGGIGLGIIDVPGHESFVRNMLAGATGIDLVLLVVAADEGVMPQTREHLSIIELLGIRRGVIAVTKSDLADPEWLELVREDVRQLVAETALAEAAMVDVSARTGAGLDVLVEALRTAAMEVDERESDDLFRMPVDRVFTVHGTGTVATGTVWSGSLRRDAQVRIEPAGLSARVRALQRHGMDTDEIRAGERAAVALVGIDRHRLTRGETLLGGTAWQHAGMLTVELTVLADAPAPLRPRQRIRVHLGTAEVLARLALPSGEVEPGASALAQLRLEQPLVARARDRLVIRSYSPVATIAGAVVLEPAPPKRKRFGPELSGQLLALRQPDRALTAVLSIAGADGVPLTRLSVTTGLPPAAVAALLAVEPAAQAGDRLFAAEHLERCRLEIVRHLRQYHAAAPLADGMEREALRRASGSDLLFDAALQQLIAEGTVAARTGVVSMTGFEPAPGVGERALLDRLAEIHAAAGLQAPELTELPADLGSRPDLPLLLRFLEREGRLVRLTSSRWADASAISSCASAVRSQLGVGEPLAVADFKQLLNLTRKHLIPLLEYFDRSGVTAREGDLRRVLRETAAASPP